MMKKNVSVHIPASSGNLGPGFDVLGLALSFGNELFVKVLSIRSGAPRFKIIGEGEKDLSHGSSNLVYRSMRVAFKKAGRKIPKLDILCLNQIPLARGLGSSSAAILSGLLAANALLGKKFKNDEILEMAAKLEGHPDNVAPALYGGIQAAGWINGKLMSTAFPVPNLDIVVAVPQFRLSTKKARAVLPRKVPLIDAVSNLVSVSFLPRALSKDNKILPYLLNDRLHEPYRARLVPGFKSVKEKARRAGALGSILSGAGPSILSFASKRSASRVASAMARAFHKRKVHCRVYDLEIDKRGAQVR